MNYHYFPTQGGRQHALNVRRYSLMGLGVLTIFPLGIAIFGKNDAVEKVVNLKARSEINAGCESL